MTHPNTEYPKKSPDITGNDPVFSVDVITVDKDNFLNLAWWNYQSKMWMFHTDTIEPPYYKGKLIDFVWMYKPKNFKVK